MYGYLRDFAVPEPARAARRPGWLNARCAFTGAIDNDRPPGAGPVPS